MCGVVCLLSVSYIDSVIMPPTVATLSAQLADLSSKFDRHTDSMKNEISNLKKLLTTQSNNMEKLAAENQSLREKVSRLENSLDDEDAYVRRETIIFNGSAIPPSTTGEICNHVIRKVIKDKLKIQIQEADISVAHRAGKKPSTQGPDRRGIQVRFCRRDVKRQIMMTKRDNSDANNTLFSNESLTPKRRSILYTLRQMKKKFPALIKGCTSQDGRIYAFTPSPSATSATRPRDRKHLVNTQEALADFSRNFIQMPLDDFLGSLEH